MRTVHLIRASALAGLLAVGSLGACRRVEVYGEPDAGDAALDARADARAPSVDAATPLHDSGSEAGAAPQTVLVPEPLPPALSDELRDRMAHLVEAMQERNPDLARDVLFPRGAFLMLSDAKAPNQVWDTRIRGGFEKVISHKSRLVRPSSKLVRVDIGKVARSDRKPGEWKVEVWQAHQARLILDEAGKTREVKLGELTAYKGAWYVTKLR
jgi:hypothetical protein